MAKKALLGHIGPCLCCGFDAVEVREDKNGHPYGYCPDCSAQVLTHGRAERVRPLLARMRPAVGAVSVTETAPAPKAAPDPKAKPLQQPAPEGVAQKAPEPEAKPAPAKKAWVFSTLLD